MVSSRLASQAKIVGICVGLSCLFGIVHDQITARIFLPYFTEFHPDLGLPHNPTVVGFAWGIIATWWVGAILGLLLSWACTLGSKPPLPLHALTKPLIVLFGAMAIGAGLFGFLGFESGADLAVMAMPDAAQLSPHERTLFATDFFAHNASYTVGFVGGLGVIAWAIYRRSKLVG